VSDAATWRAITNDYEDFFAAALFAAQYFFDASIIRFFPAALSFRLGFGAGDEAATSSDSEAAFFAAHLFF
jgi:hypothetical protein